MSQFDNEKIQEYLKGGAVILDVRTNEEFEAGHAQGSEHIVLQTLPGKVAEVKGYEKQVIAVCRSGQRSQQATDFLKQHGVDVINGGPWENVAQYLD